MANNFLTNMDILVSLNFLTTINLSKNRITEINILSIPNQLIYL